MRTGRDPFRATRIKEADDVARPAAGRKDLVSNDGVSLRHEMAEKGDL